jgi:DNA-binding transcriptional MerR regulator
MAQKRSKAGPRSTPKRPAVSAAAGASSTERLLKIGEAARAVGVEPYVLRFWETQFPILRPRHSSSKHRFYEQSDIDTLKLIKRLLHAEGFTIAGAKKHIREVGLDRLRDEAKGNESRKSAVNLPAGAEPERLNSSTQRTLAEIRNDLRSLQKLLGK